MMKNVFILLSLLSLCVCLYDTVNIDELEIKETPETAKLIKHQDNYYKNPEDRISRRKFIEMWFHYYFPEIEFWSARVIQNMVNKHKDQAKEDEKIGRVMNVLDKVMHKIKQTVLTRDQTHKILASNLYQVAIRDDFNEVLEYSKDFIKRHGQHAYGDENETNRKHLYGYEYSIRGFKDDLKEQHDDIMKDKTLDLDTE